jgi:hypothetical protein
VTADSGSWLASEVPGEPSGSQFVSNRIASPTSSVDDPQSDRTSQDDGSMRVLEWSVSVVALLAAVLIALVR